MGDGNCLFRALSDQLYGSPSRHAELRAQICDWIEKHAERYSPFVEDDRGLDAYLRCMREDATYGGHMELSAFAHLTHRNVKVIQPGLVYVIEWAAFSSPPASPVVASKKYDYDYDQYDGEDDEGDDAESEDDLPLNDRERRRVERDRIKTTPKKQKFKGKKGKQDSQPQMPTAPSYDTEGDSADKGDGTIYVAYHDWEHFSSIRNLRGPHAGLPCVKETPPPPVAEEAPRKGRAGSIVPSSKPVSTLASKPLLATEPTPTAPLPLSSASSETKKPRKVILKLKPSSSPASSPMAMDLDPTTIPLPDSRSASPLPSSPSTSSLSPPTSSASSSSSVGAQPHPLRASHLPNEASPSPYPPPHSMPTFSELHTLPAFSRSSLSSSTAPASVAAANLSPRATRSPKRSFAESESETSEGGVDVGIGGGKRTRRVSRTNSSEVKEEALLGDAMEVDTSRGQGVGGATGGENIKLENDEDTPSLSSHGSRSSSSSSSLSSLSSPESSPEPEQLEEEFVPEPEPVPKKAHLKTHGGEKPLTRRQRKALGLPKPREVLVARRAVGKPAGSAGKIIIPGGRFQRPAVRGVDDEGEGEGDGEWKTNGTGRVDVRGFRELKI
ncbi:hypothetical protein BDZ94DRAFT_1246602 [Collybia nuda]|uniref:OTU domain-containing protein n=1 Tax=Collybia nuda TaxID=64659 RepID=A0A9P5YGA9_9AGAR|nr:hypothetical protein BDZ94DRAFT_1246602 [Collybia nuda]